MYETGLTKYEVGDRVILMINNPDDNPDLFEGCIGTVCQEDDGEEYWVSVRWDDEIEGGHSCEGHCDEGHGWSVDREWISNYVEKEIQDSDIACLDEIFNLIVG